MATKLTPVPAKSKATECDKAYSIFTTAHSTAASFLTAFNKSRQTKGGKGTTTDEEQDLLRAMLIFASAGLDALIKQLIRDALPIVVNNLPGAEARFRDFVHSKTRRGDGTSDKLLAGLLVSKSPRMELLEMLVADLTGDSLQSADQIFKVASFFDIPTAEICSSPQALKQVFVVRNQIGHEMDVAFDRPNRSRRSRTQSDMLNHTNALFDLSANFIKAVETRISKKP